MKLLTALTCALSASACLLPEELAGEVPKHRRAAALSGPDADRRRAASGAFPIGTGDRFKKSRSPPKGLGTHDRDLKSLLNPREVASGLESLKRHYPSQVHLLTPPFTTHEGARLRAARIGRNPNPQVFIMSGIHARERGGPDDVLYFVGDMLDAGRRRTGLRYGNKTYSRADVAKALDRGFVVLPLVNPDGVAYDQASHSCWRKNRNPKSATPGDPQSIGIDLNRNYDFLWDWEKYFNLDADLGSAASNDPASEIFHGVAPASEPETKAVVWLMDKFPALTWFFDVHSMGGSILYSWGHENPQSKDPAQNFKNPKYDGKRGFVGEAEPANSRYKEYMTANHLRMEADLSTRMAREMSKAGPTPFTPMEAVSLYPTSGASTDYAMGRYYGHTCGAAMMHGYTLEFGVPSDVTDCPFYPDSTQYHSWMREVSTAFMEMLLESAKTKPDVYKCNCKP